MTTRYTWAGGAVIATAVAGPSSERATRFYAECALEAGLGWVVRFSKEDFLGRAALQRQKQAGVTRNLVGLVMTESGIPRQGYRIMHGCQQTGVVTSGTKSPTLGKAIALGYVASTWRQIGTNLSIEIRGRLVGAAVVSLPFYKRAV